jgi:hypothetical protein
MDLLCLPAYRVDIAFQVDSLVSNTAQCATYWKLSGPKGPPNKSYRLGLRSVLEGIARSLNDSQSKMVREIKTFCNPQGSSTRKRIRATVTMRVTDGLVPAYLERLRAAVEQPPYAFKQAVTGLKCPTSWLPQCMQYADGQGAVCSPSVPSTKCAGKNWNANVVQACGIS